MQRRASVLFSQCCLSESVLQVPLAKAYEIYTQASMATSGTVRTVRGPSMSAAPGKVQVVGITHVAGEKVFVLRFLQARNPEWCKEVFFAK